MAKATKKKSKKITKKITKRKSKTAAKVKAKAPKKATAKKAARKTKAAEAKSTKSSRASKTAKTKKAKASVKTAKKARKTNRKAAAPKATAPVRAKSRAKLTVVRPTTKPADSVAELFTPLDDRVLIKREGLSNMTPGGLYIPESVAASDRPNRGIVVAVGRGHRDKKGRLRPLDVQMGDKVMFGSYVGSEVQIGSDDYLVLREDEIIAVVKS